nr:putative glycosyltransferase [Anoectochilus roxburghii]
MSVFSMSICKFLWNNAAALAAKEPFPVPGAPPSLRLEITDIPVEIRNSVDQLKPTTQFMKSVGETDVGSWGVIVNSFMELEPPAYVELLESFYRQAGGGRTWLVGPLNLLAGDKAKNCSETECIQWLDRQPEGSVVYIAFGTQASVSDEQLDEVASGLLQAGVRFLWVVRSDTWVASIEAGDLGRIERGWVPQKEVLSHAAVGGFVSHCGWNSVLEALAAGVAVLAFPMMAEQSLNAKMVGDEIGIGLRLPAPGAGGVVGRKDVEEGVRELMGGEKGRRARKMAQEMAKKARDAVVEGGSSYLMMEKLLEELRKVPKAVAASAAAAGVVEGEETGEWSGKEVTCI